MSYFSIEFSLLLLAFFALYWVLKKSYKVQNLALLGFNYCIIYLFSPYFAMIVLIYTLIIHFWALFISTMKMRFVFWGAICCAVLFLCFFKYYASIKDEFDILLSFIGLSFLEVDIAFPLGLSFYAFASITYLRAVYEGSTESQNDSNQALQSIIGLATYLSFFPTFLAGPIMRSSFFFEQYHRARQMGDIDLIFALIILGVVKKALIASYLEIYSSPILNSPFEHHSVELIGAVCAYSVQLYCDFSGYVNLVCAFALMLGFVLPPNFNMPYTAQNLKDFWARWHISLSTFIRDFIYIPLGGNKRGFLLTQIFVLIAFGLSGMWHGNSMNFMIWGLLHGLGIVVLNCLKALQIPPMPYRLSSFITMCYVGFCWIFFYFHSFEQTQDFFIAFANGFNEQATMSAYITLMMFFISFLLYPFLALLLDGLTQGIKIIPWWLKPFALAIFIIPIIAMMPSGIPNFIYAGF